MKKTTYYNFMNNPNDPRREVYIRDIQQNRNISSVTNLGGGMLRYRMNDGVEFDVLESSLVQSAGSSSRNKGEGSSSSKKGKSSKK